MNSFSDKTHYLFLFVSLFVIISCNNHEIVYPEGGYNYPKHFEDKDTTFCFYPLKDLKSTRDSFETAYWYSFLQDFGEYNLSIRPKDNPTFRMIYTGTPTVVITLGKKVNKGVLWVARYYKTHPKREISF
jgi:hypothetical protein